MWDRTPTQKKQRLSRTYTDLILDGLAYGPLTREQFYGQIAHVALKYIAPSLYEDPIQNYVQQDIPNDQDPSKYAYYKRKVKEMSYWHSKYNDPGLWGSAAWRKARKQAQASSRWSGGRARRQMAYRSRWGTAQYARRFRPGYNRTGGSYGRYHTHKAAELKFHDFQLNDSTVANTWTVTPSINLIPQGTTEITRIGRSATIKKIQWKWRVNILAGTTPSGAQDVFRLVMYIDEQCNGSAATAVELFEVDDFQSYRNLANSHRFKVLYDRTFALNSFAGAGNGTANDFSGTGKIGGMYKTVNVPIEWDATTGAITEIRSNNIGVMMISENGACAFESQIRLRFRG